MTATEFQQVLIEGLLHTPESRVEFYLNRAKECGYKSLTFYNGLYRAYEELHKYVNSNDNTWQTKNPDGTGEKIYFKKTVNLFHLTGGKITGIIDDKNISELTISLNDLKKEINLFRPQHPGGEKQKEYKAIIRARAFCILLLMKDGKINKDAQKTELKNIISKYFPKQTGQSEYYLIRNKGFSLTDKEKYKLDYEYGKKLFNSLK